MTQAHVTEEYEVADLHYAVMHGAGGLEGEVEEEQGPAKGNAGDDSHQEAVHPDPFSFPLGLNRHHCPRSVARQTVTA